MSDRSLRWLPVLAIVSTSALAEGRFTLPLPAPKLPDGVLTVKVVGRDLRDIKVGQPVVLHEETEKGSRQKVPTGKDGRARFEGLGPDKRYVVSVKIGAEAHRSRSFPGPSKGGIRMLLALSSPSTGPGELPAGHPPIPKEMAPGSPPEDGSGEPEEGGAADIVPDPELPAGRLRVVVLRGKGRQPLSGARVQVTRGDTPKPANLPPTNEKGGTSINLEAGAKRIRVQVKHDTITYRSRRFSLPEDTGARATFLVFDRTTDPARLVLGKGTHQICQIGEGVVRFMQVMHLVHRADTIFAPGSRGLRLPLPGGAENVEIPQEMSQALVHDGHHNELRLVAPIHPDGMTLQVFYQLPYRGTELELRERVPLPMAASTVVLLKSGLVSIMGPSVKGPTAARRGEDRTVFEIDPIKAGGVLELTFVGLPHRDRRLLLVVMVLCGLIVLWGVFGVLSGKRSARAQEEKRERLLKQLAAAKEPQTEARLKRELQSIWEEPW